MDTGSQSAEQPSATFNRWANLNDASIDQNLLAFQERHFALQQSVSDAKAELEALTKQVSLAKTQLAQHLSQVDVKQAQLSQINAAAKAAQTEAADWRQRVEQMGQRHLQLTEMLPDLADLSGKYARIAKLHEEATKDLITQRALADEARRAAEIAEKERRRIQTLLTEVQQRLAERDAAILARDEAQAALKEATGQQAEVIENVRGQNQLLLDTRRALDEALTRESTARAKAVAAEAELNQLTADLVDVQQRLRERNEAVQELKLAQKAKREAEAERAKLLMDVDGLNEQMAESRQKLDDLTAEHTQVKRDAQAAEARLGELQALVQTAEDSRQRSEDATRIKCAELAVEAQRASEVAEKEQARLHGLLIARDAAIQERDEAQATLKNTVEEQAARVEDLQNLKNLLTETYRLLDEHRIQEVAARSKAEAAQAEMIRIETDLADTKQRLSERDEALRASDQARRAQREAEAARAKLLIDVDDLDAKVSATRQELADLAARHAGTEGALHAAEGRLTELRALIQTADGTRRQSEEGARVRQTELAAIEHDLAVRVGVLDEIKRFEAARQGLEKQRDALMRDVSDLEASKQDLIKTVNDLQVQRDKWLMEIDDSDVLRATVKEQETTIAKLQAQLNQVSQSPVASPAKNVPGFAKSWPK